MEYTVRLYRIHEAANGIHLEVDYQNKNIYHIISSPQNPLNFDADLDPHWKKLKN